MSEAAAVQRSHPTLQPVPGLPRSPTGNRSRLRLVAPLETGPEAPPPVPLPPPAASIQRLALYAFEALEGMRAVSQLAGTITPEVARDLQERRLARTERRTLYGDQRRIVAIPGPVHMSRPHLEAVEAAVVLHARGRTTAVALRLEPSAGRWRATSLTVL